ncbi:MAG: hypothetical protein WAN35_10800, partial [Terracidiphilus sp.]
EMRGVQQPFLYTSPLQIYQEPGSTGGLTQEAPRAAQSLRIPKPYPTKPYNDPGAYRPTSVCQFNPGS